MVFVPSFYLSTLLSKKDKFLFKKTKPFVPPSDIISRTQGCDLKYKLHGGRLIMIINHNISALNTHRQLGANNNNVQKSLEKLSSGLQINRAGDDAAGLAISEKMRAQIKGLDMASKNAQDGISLIQTAEGALSETHSILQRMRELAVQSSSDTNMDAVDREAIQGEINALVEEINDITDRTEFNTQTLLDGSFAGKFQIGANEGQSIGVSIDKMDAAALGLTKSVVGQTGVDATGLEDGSYKVDGTNLVDAKGNVV